MQSITLGRSGLQVPPLCIGTWAWGDKFFWTYGKDYSDAELRKAFETAVQAGATFFDTAEIYGMGVSETLLGQFKRETGQPIQIATKYGPAPWRLSDNAVKQAVAASLKRLGVNRIDLYQVHWPFAFLMSQSTLMNALADEVKQGHIAAIGVSNYSVEQMRQAHDLLAKRGIPLVSNQVRYSLITRKVESQGIVETARNLGMTILAYSPLAQGLLTGKYTAFSTPPSGLRQFDTRFGREGMEKITPVIKLLEEIAETNDRTPAQVALNWLISQGGVIPIVGVKSAEQVKQNIRALGWHLTPGELAELEKATRFWL